METINSMAMAAAKVVWGDNQSKEEPVSGEMGDTSKGEPYDAGNIESNEAKYTETTETTAVTESQQEENPAAAKDSSTIPKDSTEVQNDVRDPSDPQTHPENVAPKKNIDDSTGGLDTGDNPTKVDGPGPKPVDQVAREHGGDAGNSSSDVAMAGGGDDSAVSGVSDEEEESDGPQKRSHGEGTGEQYIKSTGLQADGGDFDAARAGAGREADRLLEEKGIKSVNKPGLEDNTEDNPNGKTKEKVSLMDKIKSKLHKSSAPS